jgi:hypothetical protein
VIQVARILGALALACAPSASAMTAPGPDRALLEGVLITIAPGPHRLRPDVVARIVLRVAPAGASLESIALDASASWQVRVTGPFVVTTHGVGSTDVLVERACYEVNDRTGRIWAFGFPDCVRPG